MQASQIVGDEAAKVSGSYGLRWPAIEEIRNAFGTLSRAVECSRGDLPTLLFFLANPQKIAGFKPKKHKHRNENVEFSQWLRKAATEERQAKRALERRAQEVVLPEKRDTILSWLIRYRSPADPLPLRVILKAMRMHGIEVTSAQFKSAIKDSVWTLS